MRENYLASIVSPELTYFSKYHLFQGEKEGYLYYIKKDSSNSYRIHFCVSKAGKKPDKESIAKIIRHSEIFDAFQVKGYEVVYRFYRQKNEEAFKQAIIKGLEEIILAFQKKDYHNCEEDRGIITDTFLCVQAERILFVDEKLYLRKEAHSRIEKERFMSMDNHPQRGLSGAFLGSLAGSLLSLVLGQLGVFVVMQGMLVGILTIYGYRLTAKRRSELSNLIVMVVMWLLMIIAHHLRFALFFSKQNPDYSWFEAVGRGNLYLNEIYWSQLVLLLFFSSFVYFALRQELKKQRQQFIFEKIQ